MNAIENASCGPNWANLANRCAPDWKVITALAVGIITLCAGVVLLCLASYNLLPAGVHLMGTKIGGAALIGLGALISGGASLYGCLARKGTPLEDQLDESFEKRILASDAYSPSEKERLLSVKSNLYNDRNGRPLGSRSWVLDEVTIDYLNGFAIEHPSFSTIPGEVVQFVDKTLGESNRRIVSALPLRIEEGPRVYGHAVQVNGNHRTAVIIDMINHTVEFFNSFGRDDTVKTGLEALAKALSDKYQVNFQYHHRTEGIVLQPDIYQCGIWTCKLIEERVTQGIAFDPASLVNFDIAEFKLKVYAEVLKFRFFQEVGRERYSSYLDQNRPQTESSDFWDLDEIVGELLVKKKISSDSDDFQEISNTLFNPIFVEWGKQSEKETPAIIQELVQEAKPLVAYDEQLGLKVENSLHFVVSKKFRDEVWGSDLYSPEEKKKFGRAAEKAYIDNGRIVESEDLVTSTVTIDYLNDLAMSQTHFSTIPSRMGEFKDKHFERDVEEVVGSLPLDITEGPRIYGHALSVNDNHQTGFIIDMDHHTVEYFNSFGGDRTVEKDLKALAQALGKKYGVAFQYHHRTAKVGLQSNGYDCGIWTPKLIEERVKQGIDFDPATLKKFDIASYRDEVYAKVHRLYFFRDVGEARYESLLMQNADPTVAHEEQVREYHAFSDKIDDQLVTQGHFKRNEDQKMSKWFFAIYAEWGKGAETEMPAVLREAVEKAKGLL